MNSSSLTKMRIRRFLPPPRQWPTISAKSLLDDGYAVYGANGQIGYYSEFNHEKSVIAL